MSLQVYFVLLFSLGAVCMDLLKQKVSNVWILLGWCLGLVYWFSARGVPGGLKIFLLGALLPVVLWYPLFYFRMLGAGDIKLFSVLGGFLGWKMILRGMVLSFVIGAVFSVVFLWMCGNWIQRMRYLWQYICEYGRSGELVPYKKSGIQPENFHFTIPILLGMILCVGGYF